MLNFNTNLPVEDIKRYSRQIIVPGIGVQGQKALSDTSVLIIGMGGLGSPVLTYLAMAGIKTIGIADFDKVELSNLQRQSIHSEENIGEYKTTSAKKFIEKLNSQIKIVEHKILVNRNNIEGILDLYDIIVDCCDQVSLRYLISDYCSIKHLNLVSASVLRWEGQIFVTPAWGNCYRCMFPNAKTSASNCDQSGVIGSMCGVIGCMQATEVLKLIVNTNLKNIKKEAEVKSKIIIYNGFTSSFSTFSKTYKKCSVCENGKIGEEIKQPLCTVKEESDRNIEWENIFEQPDMFFLVDIRSVVHYQMIHAENSINIVNMDEGLRQLENIDKPIAIICYRGFSSVKAVNYLTERGISAYSVNGGIERFKELIHFNNKDI